MLEVFKRYRARELLIEECREKLEEKHQKAMSVQSPKYGTTTIHGTSDGAGFTRMSDAYVDDESTLWQLEIQHIEDELELIRMLQGMQSGLHEDILYLHYIKNTPMSEIAREFRRELKQLYKELRKAEEEFIKCNEEKKEKSTKEYLLLAEREKVRAERLEDLKKRLQKVKEARRKSVQWKKSETKNEVENLIREIKGEILEKNRTYSKIRKQIMRVKNEGYQELLLMRYIDGYNLKEIASYLDMTYGSVRHKHIKAIIAFENVVKKSQ